MRYKYLKSITKLTVLAAAELIALTVSVTVKASNSCVTNLANSAELETHTTVQKSDVLKELAHLRIEIEKLGTINSGALATSLAKDYRRKLDQARQAGIDLTELPIYLEHERKLQAVSEDNLATVVKREKASEKDLSPWVLKEELIRPRPIVSYALSSDGSRLATIVSAGSEITIQDLHLAKDIAKFNSQPGAIASIQFNPDGTLLLVVTNQKTIILYDAMTGDKVQQFAGHTQTITQAAFSPNGLMIATTSADGRAGIWDIASGTPKIFLRVHEDMASTISFSADSSMVITTSKKHDVATIWDVKTGVASQNLRIPQ